MVPVTPATTKLLLFTLGGSIGSLKVTVTEVLVAMLLPFSVGDMDTTVGGTVSLYETVRAVLAAFAAASLAVTVMTFTPDCNGTTAVQLVVPLADPLPPRLFDQMSCVIPMLSVAAPPIVIVALELT